MRNNSRKNETTGRFTRHQMEQSFPLAYIPHLISYSGLTALSLCNLLYDTGIAAFYIKSVSFLFSEKLAPLFFPINTQTLFRSTFCQKPCSSVRKKIPTALSLNHFVFLRRQPNLSVALPRCPCCGAREASKHEHNSTCTQSDFDDCGTKCESNENHIVNVEKWSLKLNQ